MSELIDFTPEMYRARLGSGATPAEYPDGLNLSTRVRTITSIFPDMANDPETLLTFAQMPLSIDQLIDNSGQMMGMQSADRLSQSLSAMTPQSQRSVWSSMPKSQQMALSQMGYAPPESNEESWLGKALGPVDDIIGAGLGVIGSGVRPIITPTLETLTWIGDQPAHLYRTLRLQSDEAQWAGLLGAVAGGLAVAAAPFTAGGSLAVAGMIGLGALGGATALSAGVTSLTQNPGDWWRAFNTSWHGEQTFDLPSQRKVDELLGDPRLTGLAKDLADLEGFDMRTMVYELAGIQGTSPTQQFDKIQELAARFGGEGTPEFSAAAQAILNVAQDPLFQEAVVTLQDGKISPGRDFADLFGAIGLDNDSGLYSMLSGVVDGAFMVAVDPTLMLGGISKWRRAQKYGLKVLKGSPAVEEFRRVSALPEVRKYQEFFVDAVKRGSVQDIRTYTPEMTQAVMPFLNHLNASKIDRTLATVDDLHDYMIGASNLRPLLEGVGTVRGAKGIVLANLNSRSMFYREMAGNLRAFTGALSDPKLERRITEMVTEAAEKGDPWTKLDVDGQVMMLPGLSDVVVDETTGELRRAWAYNQKHQAAVQAGRAIGRLPGMSKVGDFITATTTMVPPERTISLTGKTAVQDVKALAELGRYMGMPSWARRAWADAILFSDNPAQRMLAINGWLDNALTIAGARTTAHGSRLVDDFLLRSKMAYGVGDDIIVNGNPVSVGLFLNDQADEIAMPSLHQLHRAAATGHMGGLLGVLDAPVLDGYINRIWKPAVLLRVGFITRAAGEEMLNFMFRGGFGGLVQQTAAREVGRGIAFKNVLAKVRNGGSLSPEEAAMYAYGERVGGLVSGTRTVARMMSRYNWNDPFLTALDDFSNWTRKGLEEGLPFFNRLEAPVVRALDRLAGQELAAPVRKVVGAEDGWFARTYADARLNVAEKANVIFVGSKHSWRRMALGGVDEELIDAAREMQSATAKAIMDEVSSTNAGPYDRGHDPAREHTRYMMNRDGELVEKATITMRSQPSIYNSSQWEYANGLHHRALTHLAEDPTAALLAQRHISRIKPASVSDEVADRLIRINNTIFTEDAQFLAREFMGSPSRDGFLAALVDNNQIDRKLAAHLEAWVATRSDLDVEDVIEGVEEFLKYADDLPVAFIEDLQTDLGLLREQARTLDGMNANDRAWAGQMLRLGTGDQVHLERQVLDESVLPIFQQNRERAKARRIASEDAAQEQFDIEIDTRSFLADAEERRDAARRAYHELMADPPEGAKYTYETIVPGPLADLNREIQALENPTPADVRRWREAKLAEARDEQKMWANELGRLGATVDDANLKPTFALRPIKGSPEWEWWYQLTPKTRQRLARQYFNGSAERVDVLASQAGMTPDEWGEKFLELTGKHTEASAATRTGASRWTPEELRDDILRNDPDLQQMYDARDRMDAASKFPKPFKADLHRGMSSIETDRIELLDDGSLVLRPAENFDGRTYGVSFTSKGKVADDYASRLPGGVAGVRHDTGVVVEIDTRRLPDDIKSKLRDESGDGGDFERAIYGGEVTLPPGSFRIRPAVAPEGWTARRSLDETFSGLRAEMELGAVPRSMDDGFNDYSASMELDNIDEYNRASEDFNDIDRLEQADTDPMGGRRRKMDNARHFALRGKLGDDRSNDALRTLAQFSDDEIRAAWPRWVAENGRYMDDPNGAEYVVRAVQQYRATGGNSVDDKLAAYFTNRERLLAVKDPLEQRRVRRYGRTKASMAFAEQSQLYQQLQRDVVMWQNRVKEVAAGGPQLQTAAYLAQQNLDLAAQQYDAVLASRNGWANNWNDVHERMVDTAYGHLLNAYNQNREMYSAMSVDRLQPFKEGQAIVWEVPRPAPGMTYEQVLVAATDRSVIAANEQLVRKWLKQDWARATDEMGPGIGAVADKQLADQLFTVVRPGGHLPQQTARGYRADGAVLQGRAMPGFVPIHAAEADKPLLWRLDESIHTQWENFDRAGGLTEKVRKQAEQMVGRMRQIGTKESRQVLRAQGRVGEIKEEGAIYPRVYRRLQGGELEPVAPGTIVRDNETYVDMKNRPIRPGHPMYFAEDVLDAETQGDVMWALVGPMYEDMADQLQQVERWAPAHRYTLRDEGRVKPSTDRVRVYRSDRSHVNNVDFGLPRYVTAPTIRDVDGNMWDRIVRYGFDRIIGPAIDSLARKPMAFHFFAERYSYSKRVASQFRSQQIMEEMEGVLSKVGAASNPDLDVDSVAAASRRLAAFTTSDNTTQWSDQMALGWLRGHDEKELTTMLDGVLARTKVRVTPEARQAYVDAFKLKNRDPAKVLSTFKSSGNADEFMAYARSIMGERIADPVFWSTFDGQQLISQNEILNSLDQADWDTIAKSEREIARIRREAGEYAATAAINDMIPFIDSHELRTQMAEFAKPLMPFWYAEENFLKRWVRTALDQGPVSTVRKAQLAYAGLKSGGIIRTDENGVDYFVYPGSSLLIEAVAKVWPGAELPVGALFQTRTDAILPGMSAARIGQPAFSPMLSVPMNLISQRVPELAPVQRAMFGDFSASTSALSQFVPNSLQRFFEAFTASGEASARYASAQMSAIAMMEASGKGLPDNATAGEQDEYLRKVNEHARIILVSQALMGFFVPGPPQQVVAGEDSITGLGIEDPRNVLSTLYQDMISTFGIEQGTIEFLETYPMANLHNIAAVTADGSAPVLGLVEGRSDSRSGAPLPPTTTAMDFYAINKNYMQEMPFAGPWLLPTSDGSARDQYAYDQQVINGLRQQSTPEEFLRSIKFKEAAGPYFEARTAYLDRIAALEVAKASPEEIAAAKDAWDTYSTVWKVTHPIFKEELESSEGRTRRARTIAEMQRVINDPAAPKPAHFQAMQETMQSYNNYKTQLTILSQDRSAKGEAKVERLKRDYSAFMDRKSRTNSTVRAFWTSVLRPEASLD